MGRGGKGVVAELRWRRMVKGENEATGDVAEKGEVLLSWRRRQKDCQTLVMVLTKVYVLMLRRSWMFIDGRYPPGVSTE